MSKIIILIFLFAGGLFDTNRTVDLNNSNKSKLLSLADTIRVMVNDYDIKGLSEYIHPQKGILLSPQEHMFPEENRTLQLSNLIELEEDDTKYKWGEYDCSNLPIIMTFREFWNYFTGISDPDTVSFNQRVSSGNWKWNAAEVFTGSVFIEFHNRGTQARDFMDWYSLFVVFEYYEPNKKWFLVALAAGYWSI